VASPSSAGSPPGLPGSEAIVGHISSRGAELSVARTSRAVFKQLTDAGLVDLIGVDGFYPSVRSAVRDAPEHLGAAY
jgi:hypothetical protein